MKATELRICNIVTVDNPKYHPHLKGVLLRVTGIREQVLLNKIEYCVQLEHINKKANTYYQTYSQYMEYIKPVALTEQWLLDLGFKICTKSGVHNGWSIGENPLTNDYLMFLVWMKNEDGTLAELFYRNGYHTIKYVHQLQNLYSILTNEELIKEEKPLFVAEDIAKERSGIL